MDRFESVSTSWMDTVKARCVENLAIAESLPPDEEELRTKRVAVVAAESEIPAKFASSTLQNAEVLDGNRVAWEACRAFVSRGFTAPGVGLFGPVGTGKTRLLCAVANAAVMAEKRAVVLTTTELVLRLRATFGTKDESEWSLIQRLVHTPVLIVDDLGKEQITEWSAQNLFEFFNARYNAGLPILVSANLTLGDLQKSKYDKPPEGVDKSLMLSVVDRIREMTGPWIPVAGKSRRRVA